MSAKQLTAPQWQSLSWLAEQTTPAWGGLYDYDGDSDVVVLTERGLIERVAEPHDSGFAHFAGGFRITSAGRAALSQHQEKE